jgi:translation initiation factor 1 (eIF-1/SUI1)
MNEKKSPTPQFEIKKTKLKISVVKLKSQKTFTEVGPLPFDRDFFQYHLKILKGKLGAGGSLDEHITDKKVEVKILIQGDHQKKLQEYFQQLGFIVS